VSARSRRRFEEEVEILGRLEHQSIARIYEGGVVPGPLGDQPYFVMQLGVGKPLTQHADEHGLNLAARVRLLVRICEAVEHAHGKLVVHCDLKPANILVTAEESGDDPQVGRPLILDFGIAQVLGRAEVEQAAGKGTPGFMAPEQEAGERPDVRWDVFAIGKIGALLVPKAGARRDRHHREGFDAILDKTPAGGIARSRSCART
jgi:serine/threonine protein kinase